MARASGQHTWVSYLDGGKPSEKVKQATDLSSGAYAIRRKDSHGVIYVGESNLGHMWRTLARHFQAPATFTATKKPGGANAFATDTPGDYEVTWQITSRGKRAKGHGDQAAMRLQARSIKKFRKQGHKLHNRDDGMANEDAAREFREHRAKQAAAESERPWYENPAAGVPLTQLGRLTRLEMGSRVLVWPLEGAPVLAYDGAGRLHIVYLGKVVRASTPREIDEYKRTHWGAEPRGKVSGGSVAVGPWEKIGLSTSVTYTTRKGRDAEPVDYVHAWGEGKPRGKRHAPPSVVAHRCAGGCGSKCAAKGAIALSGGTYVVSDRGIVG